MTVTPAEARHIWLSLNRMRDERFGHSEESATREAAGDARPLVDSLFDCGDEDDMTDPIQRILHTSDTTVNRVDRSEATEQRQQQQQRQRKKKNHEEEDSDYDEDEDDTERQRREEERQHQLQEQKRAAGLSISLEKFSEPSRRFQDRQSALTRLLHDSIEHHKHVLAVKERLAALHRVAVAPSSASDAQQQQQDSSTPKRLPPAASGARSPAAAAFLGPSQLDLPPAQIIYQTLTDATRDEDDPQLSRAQNIRMKLATQELRREFGCASATQTGDSSAFGGGGSAGGGLDSSISNLSFTSMSMRRGADERHAAQARRLHTAVHEAAVASRLGGREQAMPALETLLDEQDQMTSHTRLFSSKTAQTGHAALVPMLQQQDPTLLCADERILAMLKSATEGL